jgi:hypothetical protein
MQQKKLETVPFFRTDDAASRLRNSQVEATDGFFSKGIGVRIETASSSDVTRPSRHPYLFSADSGGQDHSQIA